MTKKLLAYLLVGMLLAPVAVADDEATETIQEALAALADNEAAETIKEALEEGDFNVEIWHCLSYRDYVEYEVFDRYSKEKVMVEITSAYKDGFGFARVSVASMDYPAFYSVKGINRRWDFGNDFNFSITLKPDGNGAYYDFSDIEAGESTSPEQTFRCIKKEADNPSGALKEIAESAVDIAKEFLEVILENMQDDPT